MAQTAFPVSSGHGVFRRHSPLIHPLAMPVQCMTASLPQGKGTWLGVRCGLKHPLRSGVWLEFPRWNVPHAFLGGILLVVGWRV